MLNLIVFGSVLQMVSIALAVSLSQLAASQRGRKPDPDRPTESTNQTSIRGKAFYFTLQVTGCYRQMTLYLSFSLSTTKTIQALELYIDVVRTHAGIENYGGSGYGSCVRALE
ncbi:hypothetical protein BDV93DRAFT_525304 [Ceratobasidium sp. AG-I]|nr:hypothetical protein BDV93DRAFT_525304 [Ceratobasidium sp. AG-I]